MFLHNSNDLPDAQKLHPVIWLDTNEISDTYVSYKKIYIERYRSKNDPCLENSIEACKSLKSYQKFIQDVRCHIPILNIGKHMEVLYSENLMNCSKKQILAYFEDPRYKQKCKNQQVCKTYKYHYMEKKYEYNGNGKNETSVRFILQDPEVEHYHTAPDYDLQSLISEIGGVLGITLGASGLSLILYSCKAFQILSEKYSNRKKLLWDLQVI